MNFLPIIFILGMILIVKIGSQKVKSAIKRRQKMQRREEIIWNALLNLSLAMLMNTIIASSR